MRFKILEITAVLSNLAYTLLYLNESTWAWPCAILGAVAYFLLCKKNNLIGESWLQILYVGAAIFGWWAPLNNFQSPFHSWAMQIGLFAGSIIAWIIAKTLLQKRQTSFPWLDSFALIFGITGTLLQVAYSPMNWYYFLLVNLVSMYTYWNKGMKLSILLYVVYFLLSLQGIYYSMSS
jgi:nicotinamide mononucleotide transporter